MLPMLESIGILSFLYNYKVPVILPVHESFGRFRGGYINEVIKIEALFITYIVLAFSLTTWPKYIMIYIKYFIPDKNSHEA